jgi:hypothetical protein
MLCVILAWVLTLCPRWCSKDWDILLLLQPQGQFNLLMHRFDIRRGLYKAYWYLSRIPASSQTSWSLICKMMRKCHSFLGGCSYVTLGQGSMWKTGPSVFALGRRTWCSDFDQQKSNAIQCKEMMSKLGDGRSHNPNSRNLWPHQENQGKHGRCGRRHRDHTPLTSREWSDEWN